MSARDAARAVFADVLDYPGPGFRASVEGGVARFTVIDVKAAELLRQFLDSIRPMRLGDLQELYTATFDFRPGCSLHAGWHLFGDDPRRGVFLVGLVERYHARGFSAGKELPDHLPLLFRFVSSSDAMAEEIVADALVPALTALARELGTNDNPYSHAVASALALLEPSDAGRGDGITPPTKRAVATRQEG